MEGTGYYEKDSIAFMQCYQSVLMFDNEWWYG